MILPPKPDVVESNVVARVTISVLRDGGLSITHPEDPRVAIEILAAAIKALLPKLQPVPKVQAVPAALAASVARAIATPPLRKERASD